MRAERCHISTEWQSCGDQSETQLICNPPTTAEIAAKLLLTFIAAFPALPQGRATLKANTLALASMAYSPDWNFLAIAATTELRRCGCADRMTPQSRL
jgi:hypothetical protein